MRGAEQALSAQAYLRKLLEGVPGIVSVNRATNGRKYSLWVRLERQCDTSLSLIPTVVDGLRVDVELTGHAVEYGARTSAPR